VIETHNDHRIAMAFAISGLARGNVTIGKEQVVTKSYPGFWKTLDRVLSGETV
jgi:3-phosphoshikimate 1-carboxyvinyltransferase